MKKVLWTLVVIVAIFVIALIGGSFYMLNYSLAPDPNRMDTDSCYRQQFDAYPESQEWVDSLRSIGALRDTFLIMPSGEKHHGFFVDRGSTRTALVIHGWRDCAIKFFWLARIYEHELGYNVVMPELHACGESEGEAIQMGWKDRLDVLQWMKTFQADTMVVHGVSMGAATTMMLSGEQMPDGIKDLHFVELALCRGLRLHLCLERIRRSIEGAVRFTSFPADVFHESALSSPLWLEFWRGISLGTGQEVSLSHVVHSW